MRESAIQREIVDFLKMLGAAVYQTSQGYRKDPGGTRCTPGIPDLYAMHPDLPSGSLWIECKTRRGRLSPAQQAFADECATCGVPWALWRSVEEAWGYCVGIGLVEEIGAGATGGPVR